MGDGVVPGAGTSIGGAIGGVSCGAGVGCPGWDGWAGGCGAGVSGGGCVAMCNPFAVKNAARP